MIELFKDILQFFKKNIRAISILTLAIEFPFILIQNIHYFSSNSSEFSNNISSIFFMATLVIYPFSTGAQISLYSMILKAPKIDLKKCISDSLKNLLNLIVASLIYLSFTFLGLLAFIIPGIIVGVRLSFYGFFIVLDDLKPAEALKKSAQATKEYTWLMAGSLFVIGILLILPLFLIQQTLNRFGFRHSGVAESYPGVSLLLSVQRQNRKRPADRRLNRNSERIPRPAEAGLRG